MAYTKKHYLQRPGLIDSGYTYIQVNGILYEIVHYKDYYAHHGKIKF